MHPLVEKIEQLFVPDMERIAIQMQARFPALKFDTWQWPTNSEPDSKDYDFGVECLFPVSANGAPATVAMVIELCFLNSKPRLNGSVVWGHPSGYPEAEFTDDHLKTAEWPEANPETIEELRAFFPALTQAFISAVERGIPSDAT
jgi:hypothetical protein